MSRTLDFLRASQNADGGWGYKPNGMTFVEPTAAAVVALSPDVQNRDPVQRARALLRSLQHSDGGWGIAAPDDESGWMTAWAVWALASGEDADVASAQRGAEWLFKTAGIRVTDPAQIAGVEKVLQINPSITGWPWQPGDAAWIFPTAVALLAFDALKLREHPRATEGIQYLLDRAITGGGWNIGNPFMVTGSLPPTVENTALALIALHVYGIKNDTTSSAQAVLAQTDFTPTAWEWAWRALYWKIAGLSVDNAQTALQTLQRPDGSWDNNPFTTALVSMALDTS